MELRGNGLTKNRNYSVINLQIKKKSHWEVGNL